MSELVETNATALDDTALEEVAEDASETIESLTEQPQEEAPAPSEPGWIRKRIDKAVDKAVAAAEQRVAAQYEAVLTPLRNQLIENEAKELVGSGEFKSLERAKEYLQLKNGITPTVTPQPARDEQGRFTKGIDPAVQAQADFLTKQANKIKANRGIDVMAAYNANEEYREKILSGEWDFYDVADAMSTRRKTPSPMRSPNGASGEERSSVASMTSEEFRKLNENLEAGKRYSV